MPEVSAEVFWRQQGKKLGARRWSDVASGWINMSIPVRAGATPEDVGELIPLVEIKQALRGDELVRRTSPPEGLRESLLLEAVFLVHKAAHVLGAAQVHRVQGMWSWSLSSAYQSAAFSMRSIMMLMGVSVLKVDNAWLFIDAWAPPEGNTRREREAPPGVLLRKARQADHKALWALFQRLLRIANVDAKIWPTSYVSELLEIKPTEFSHQRNQLHYRNNFWPQSDLHACMGPGDFGTPGDHFPADGQISLDPESDDFSLALGGTLMFLTLRLLVDLADRSTALTTELDLMRTWLSNSFLEPWRSILVDDAFATSE